MKATIITLLTGTTLLTGCMNIKEEHSGHIGLVPDEVIANQRYELATNTKDKGFGPQAPRDIDLKKGTNNREFSIAPDSRKMNLCNIHFHKNAEHKGG